MGCYSHHLDFRFIAHQRRAVNQLALHSCWRAKSVGYKSILPLDKCGPIGQNRTKSPAQEARFEFSNLETTFTIAYLEPICTRSG